MIFSKDFLTEFKFFYFEQQVLNLCKTAIIISSTLKILLKKETIVPQKLTTKETIAKGTTINNGNKQHLKHIPP